LTVDSPFSNLDGLVIVGIPKEIYPGERRVALVPAVVPSLVKAGIEVVVERAAGSGSGYPDEDYVAKGARLVTDRDGVFAGADVVLQVLCHGANDVNGAEDLPRLRAGQAVIGFVRPLASPQTVRELAERGVTAIAVELIPRTSRAQAMDVLSAMSMIAGRRWMRPTPASARRPSPSGPRDRMASLMARRAALSGTWALFAKKTPAIPHIW